MAHNMVEGPRNWIKDLEMMARLACARFVTQDRGRANFFSSVVLSGILGPYLEREPGIVIDSTGKLITLPAEKTVGDVLEVLTGNGLPSRQVPQCGVELALQLAKPGYTTDLFPPSGVAVPDIQFLSALNRVPLPEHCIVPVEKISNWELVGLYAAAVVVGPLIVVAGIKLLIEGVNSVNGFRSWLDQPSGLGSNFEATLQAQEAQRAERAVAPKPPAYSPGPGLRWGRADVDEFGKARWPIENSPDPESQRAREDEADRVLKRGAERAAWEAGILESKVKGAVAGDLLSYGSSHAIALEKHDRERLVNSAAAPRITVNRVDARQQTVHLGINPDSGEEGLPVNNWPRIKS